jgi:drug/metabolite transporter (DMT)-like permease
MSMQTVNRPLFRPNFFGRNSAVVAGILLMLAGDFIYVLSDALGKWLVATYSVGQLMAIRSAAALILLAPFAWRAGRAPFAAMPRPGLQVLRVALSSLEVVCFFSAVVYLPLADVTTFYLAGPIFVTALAPFLLGETIGWQRLAGVIVGFVGVVVAMRPSFASVSGPALVALGGSLCFALLMMVTRSLRGTSDVALLVTQMLATFACGAILAPIGWVTPNGRDFALLAFVGVVAMLGLFCVNRALALAPASVVVPYQYSFILWAIVLGYLVFGDVPEPALLTGAAIIVAAGIFLFWRERDSVGDGEVLPPVG